MTEEGNGIDYKGITVALGSVIVAAGARFLEWDLVFLSAAAVVISIVIWQACDPFAEAAQWLGKTLRIPGSVRGATLDAIASSLPELFSGIFFVWVAIRATADGTATSLANAGAEGFGSTIATCAGSAVYNMILIPASVAFVVSIRRKSRPTVDVEPEVLSRDGLWFLGAECLLLIFLFQDAMYWWMALAFFGLYILYILQLRAHAKRFRRELENRTARDEVDDDELPESASVFFGLKEIRLNMLSVWTIIVLSTAVAATACWFLVGLTRTAAGILEVPTFFVAVILAAAVSSVPDTFLSIGSAMRGDDSGAVSNAFGSNIFDICICIPIPLLVLAGLTGWEPVSLLQDGEPMRGLVGLRMLLWVLTSITLAIMWHKRQLTRTKAFVLVGLYCVFIAYAVIGSLGLFGL